MEKYIYGILIILIIIFVCSCLVYAIRYIAAQDLRYFCNNKIDRFPIESIYCLTVKDVEMFQFMFSVRVTNGNDREAIYHEIIKLKGPRGQILKKAYDLAVNN